MVTTSLYTLRKYLGAIINCTLHHLVSNLFIEQLSKRCLREVYYCTLYYCNIYRLVFSIVQAWSKRKSRVLNFTCKMVRGALVGSQGSGRGKEKPMGS